MIISINPPKIQTCTIGTVKKSQKLQTKHQRKRTRRDLISKQYMPRWRASLLPMLVVGYAGGRLADHGGVTGDEVAFIEGSLTGMC
jgi:hypothetical protein